MTRDDLFKVMPLICSTVHAPARCREDSDRKTMLHIFVRGSK